MYPRNLEEILTWQDDDAKEYLMKLRDLDLKGVLKL
jgi:hypothetical protein